MRACASLQVFTTAIAGGGTSVVIRVRNLAGSYNIDNSGGSVITRIGIIAPIIAGANGGVLNMSTVGGASSVGSPQQNWFLRNPGTLAGAVELTAGITHGTLKGGIIGCSTPRSGLPVEYFQTCNAASWIEFSFTTSNDWSAADAELAWLVQDPTNLAGGNGLECGTDATTGNRELCATVTPEPVTMMLLGSGLAGMGGFGLRRRRKGNDVSNS